SALVAFAPRSAPRPAPRLVVSADGGQGAGAALGHGLEVAGELPHRRADEIPRLDVEAIAELPQELALRRVDEGEHDQRAQLRRALDDLLHLRLEAHLRVEADAALHILELEQRRPDHPLGGVAGRVADDDHGLHGLSAVYPRTGRCRRWLVTRGHSGSGARRLPATCADTTRQPPRHSSWYGQGRHGSSAWRQPRNAANASSRSQ